MALPAMTVATNSDGVIGSAYDTSKVDAAFRTALNGLDWVSNVYDIVAGSLTSYDNPNDLIGLHVNTHNSPHTVGVYTPSSSSIAAERRARLKNLVRIQIDEMPLALHFIKDGGGDEAILHGFLRKNLAAMSQDANLVDQTRHDYIEANAKVDIRHFAAYRGTVGSTELISAGSGATNAFYVLAHNTASPPVYTVTARSAVTMPALSQVDGINIARHLYE